MDFTGADDAMAAEGGVSGGATSSICAEHKGVEIRCRAREVLLRAQTDGHLALALAHFGTRASSASTTAASSPVGSASAPSEALEAVVVSGDEEEDYEVAARREARELLNRACLDGRLALALSAIVADHAAAALERAAGIASEDPVAAAPAPEALEPAEASSGFTFEGASGTPPSLAADPLQEAPYPLALPEGAPADADESGVSASVVLPAPAQLAEELDDDDLEGVRAHARAILLQASLDGRLAEAIEAARPRTLSAGSLQARAREMLFAASASGRLATALRDVLARQRRRGAAAEFFARHDSEALRQQARETLMQASASGALHAALNELSGDQEDEPAVYVTRATRVIEEARLRARHLLSAPQETCSLEESGGDEAVAGLISGPVVPPFAMCTICLDFLVPPRRRAGSSSSSSSEAAAESAESGCSVEDPELCLLPCLHAFHASCAEGWLRSRSTCPNCRLRADL
eukprot:TRINITY_DN30066_c0_g1_i1.p1 TRINITY_DN30066_c0_g1~~TRINITY_DN30066_c0_g1_i1.p1  ORF type:complete len:467 (+),score=118.45 TRINITY_DN30066_c0_g1_i1:104-1504(+)